MLLTSVSIVAQVPQSVVKEVVSEADVRRYETYGMRSFVEDNRQLTWCPSPGCEHAVEARVEVGSEPMDIACSCGATFCFQCKEEAHRPVSTSACNFQGCYAAFLSFCSAGAEAGNQKVETRLIQSFVFLETPSTVRTR
jgi:hypothetical protein